mgnify:CR=1 FL=1
MKENNPIAFASTLMVMMINVFLFIIGGCYVFAAMVVQPITKSSAEQVMPYYQLRPCVLAAYRRHAAMTLLMCQLVHCRRQSYIFLCSFSNNNALNFDSNLMIKLIVYHND